jgi:hypothetical protein
VFGQLFGIGLLKITHTLPWQHLREIKPLMMVRKNSKARACQITMGYMEVYPALEQTSHSQEKDAFCFGHGCRNRTVMDVSRTRHQDVESGHIHTGREERRKETPTNCSFEIRRV